MDFKAEEYRADLISTPALNCWKKRDCVLRHKGYPLKRGNFYRKMVRYVILEKQEETRRSGTPHKSPNLYKFDIQKYKDALKDGLHEGRKSN